MDFAGSRLYELLRWSIPAAIGFFMFLALANEVKRPIFSILRGLDFKQYIDQLDQLQEKKDVIVASSGYTHIDDIIAIEKQIFNIENHNSMSYARANIISHCFLILIGLLLILGSVWVNHEAVRVVLAAIGSVFVVVEAIYGTTDKLSLVSQMVIYLLFAISAYMLWHFLSKKYDAGRMQRYIFLQLCGALSLSYALVVGVSVVRDRLFTLEVVKAVYDRQNKLELLLNEQQELLKNEQLNEMQKERYVELAKMIDVALRQDSVITSQDGNLIKEHLHKERVYALIVAIFYIVLGTFVNMPWLFSFGFISSGAMMLYGLQLYRPMHQYLPTSYVIGAGILLLLVCYRLYYQRKIL